MRPLWPGAGYGIGPLFPGPHGIPPIRVSLSLCPWETTRAAVQDPVPLEFSQAWGDVPRWTQQSVLSEHGGGHARGPQERTPCG